MRNEELIAEIARRLKAARCAKGMTYEKVRFTTGLDVYVYENGKKAPGYQVMAKFLACYGITFEEFHKGM